MESSNWEKETLLSNSHETSQPELPKQTSRSERRRTLLLVSCLLFTNLLSFLVGCSLSRASVIWKDIPHSSPKAEQHGRSRLHPSSPLCFTLNTIAGFLFDIDRTTLHDTVFEPFSYVMSKYTTPAGGEIDVDAEWEALGATRT